MRQDDATNPALTRDMTRRGFLAKSAREAAAVGLASSTVRAAQTPREKSRVLLVSHPGVMDEKYRVDPAVLSKMVQVGLKSLTGKTSIRDAWQHVAKPGERITAKWNEIGFRPIETRKELRGAVLAGLTGPGGHDASKVLMFSRIECKGDAASIVKVPIPHVEKDAKLRKLFTHHTDCLINLPVLKSINFKSVSISLKNHFGSIANPWDFHTWDNGKDMGKTIIELNCHPGIKDKTRLIIVDALRPQWEFGPLSRPQFRWRMNTLMFGFDTVAIDAVGLDIIEQKRKKCDWLKKHGRNWQFPWARRMLSYGEEKGLGIADLNRIEIERIELKA